jgi:CDP-diacylglycerol--glycerol-3-phosphate 3-phosphatidyltransferase
MRLADKFSMVRVVFAPVFLVFYLLALSEESIIPWFHTNSLIVISVLTVLLALVEFTDYLDGNTARKLKQVSDTGKLLDPFADAILHITTFFCFTYTHFMPAALFMIVFYREFGMIFLRMNVIRTGVAIAARMGGKFKTVLYIASGFWTLAVIVYEKSGLTFIPFDLRLVCVILFCLCAVAAIVSFIDYIFHFVIAVKK